MQSIQAPDLSLPESVSLFPLSGVVLMPFAHLPLNIFEDRYIAMIDDALKGDRMIGLVQPKGDARDPVPADAPIYDVGTLGRIYAFIDPGDGSYQITLQGVSRFSIERETPHEHGYRTASVNFQSFLDDLTADSTEDGPGREPLVELMHDFMDLHEIDVDWEVVDEVAYHALISSLVMSSPFSSSEKQALLECIDPHDRARLLMQVIHMTLETRGVAGAARH